MRFVEKIDRLREARGITSQKALGEMIGVPQPVISDWGKKKSPEQIRLNLVQLHALGRALGVPLEYLLDDEQDEPTADLSEDDRYVLRTFRNSGLTADQVGKAIHAASRALDPAPSRFNQFNDRKADEPTPVPKPARTIRPRRAQ